MKVFINVASHEIRHPVAGIARYAQTLLELWDELKIDDLRLMLESIRKGAERLVRLSKRLLDVSSIQRDVFQVRIEEVDLGEVIREWHELEAGRNLGDRLILSLGTGLGRGFLDPMRLQELLAILVDNAAKFSPPESPIEVEASRNGDRLEVK